MPDKKYPLIICEICGLPDGVRKIPDLEVNCDCKGRLCRAHCITGHGTHAGTEQPEPYRAEFIKWNIRNKSRMGETGRWRNTCLAHSGSSTGQPSVERPYEYAQ